MSIIGLAGPAFRRSGRLSSNVRPHRMTDDDLRRKLLRDYLGELFIMALVTSFAGVLLYYLMQMAFTQGTIVLNGGPRNGPVVPVELTWISTPYAMNGALCLYLAFFGFIASLMASPAYHVLRTGAPKLRLPRVPKTSAARTVRRIYFAALCLLALVGTALVLAQYLLTSRL